MRSKSSPPLQSSITMYTSWRSVSTCVPLSLQMFGWSSREYAVSSFTSDVMPALGITLTATYSPVDTCRATRTVPWAPEPRIADGPTSKRHWPSGVASGSELDAAAGAATCMTPSVASAPLVGAAAASVAIVRPEFPRDPLVGCVAAAGARLRAASSDYSARGAGRRA